MQRAAAKLPPEVNRILLVRNLPFKITAEEMYEIFGKFGAIRQIRMCGPLVLLICCVWVVANFLVGTAADTKGTAFVVYEDIYDAKNACERLSGFNVQGRYLIVLYYQPTKVQKKVDLQKQREDLDKLKEKHAL